MPRVFCRPGADEGEAPSGKNDGDDGRAATDRIKGAGQDKKNKVPPHKIDRPGNGEKAAINLKIL